MKGCSISPLLCKGWSEKTHFPPLFVSTCRLIWDADWNLHFFSFKPISILDKKVGFRSGRPTLEIYFLFSAIPALWGKLVWIRWSRSVDQTPLQSAAADPGHAGRQAGRGIRRPHVEERCPTYRLLNPDPPVTVPLCCSLAVLADYKLTDLPHPGNHLRKGRVTQLHFVPFPRLNCRSFVIHAWYASFLSVVFIIPWCALRVSADGSFCDSVWSCSESLVGWDSLRSGRDRMPCRKRAA